MIFSGGSTLLEYPGGLWALAGVALAFVLPATLAPRWSENALRAISRPFEKLATRKTLAISLLFFSVIGDRLAVLPLLPVPVPDRKSTRLNSSHVAISYAVFCLKKKKCQRRAVDRRQTR